MAERKQKIIFGILLVLGLTIFILQIFIFQAPNGVIGFLICLLSVELIIVSLIKLSKLSKQFRKDFARFLDLLFRIPWISFVEYVKKLCYN